MITIESFRKIKPMLATSSKPFDSKDHIFEIKWDGFRCLSYLGASDTVLQSRNRLDFTFKFPELAGIHTVSKSYPVVLDGEIIIMEDGVPSFYELQKRGWMKDKKAIKSSALLKPAVYVVFDILYKGDQKLTGLPLADRRSILRETLNTDERIVISEGVQEYGIEFYKACINRNLEGVVAKKLDSRYVPGKRSANWLKIKKVFEGDFVICGYKKTHPNSERVDVLLLGCFKNGEIIPQGTVGVGLSGYAGRQVYSILHHLNSEKPLFEISKEVSRGLIWVEPVITCSVEFLEPAHDGGMRHAVFKGIRYDLKPEECTGIAGAVKGQ